MLHSPGPGCGCQGRVLTQPWDPSGLPLQQGLGSASRQEDSQLAPHFPVLPIPCGPMTGM